MVRRLLASSRVSAFAAVAVFAVTAGQAHAIFPYLPLTSPPPVGVSPEPPVLVDPTPTPPVHNTPEPGTLVLGAIGTGIAGLVARRKRKQAKS
ncbi:MAG: PEP-CTERM sorting domain-containing protein [Gemmataceae bacterium]